MSQTGAVNLVADCCSAGELVGAPSSQEATELDEGRD